jgi:O-antigen ligase
MPDNFAISAGRRSPGWSNAGWYGSAAKSVRRILSAAGSAFVTSVLLPFAVLATQGRWILLALVILDIPLQISHHSFYRDDAALRGALDGLEISVSGIALALLYIAWLVGLSIRPELFRRPTFRTSLPLVLYVAFVGLSVFAADDLQLFSFEFWIMVEMLFLYIYLINWIRTRQDVMFFVTLLLLGMVLESLLMIGLRVNGGSLSAVGIKLRVDDADTTGVPRIGGTLGSANGAATYFAALLAPALSILIMRISRWYDILAAGAFFLGGVGLLLTFSRGGWLASAIAASIVVLCGWRLLRPGHKVLFVFGIVFVLGFLGVQKAVSDRVFNEETAASRIPLMKVALRMIADHPFIGVGANNYTLNMDQYATRDLSGEWMYAVHNRYLLICAETGPGALAAFLWFGMATLGRGWKCWKFKDSFVSPLALGLTAGLVGYAIALMFEPGRGSLMMVLLLVAASLIAAMHSWLIAEGSPRTGHARVADTYRS